MTDEALLALLPELLLPWFAANRRTLPWREDREPYHVWLSEIMLQQTRVEAVRGYYLRFLQALPTVTALAAAPEEQLLKLWEGLGYYTRVRNLQRAAQEITARGAFPQDYNAVRALPGIGAYTAGAICSICFEQPTAAVDGNVLRVFSRYLASSAPIGEEKTKKAVTSLLSAVYPAGHCGDFTQALMELGATVCLPNGAPQCARCPLAETCRANAAGTQLSYPVKAKKRPRRVEERTVLLLRCGDCIAVCRRPDKGLLAGLWQLPDAEGTLTAQQALELAAQWQTHPVALERTVRRKHIFTHITWELTGVWLQCTAMPEQFSWFTPAELRQDVSLPTAYRQFLEDII